jgi:hypothetical protein
VVEVVVGVVGVEVVGVVGVEVVGAMVVKVVVPRVARGGIRIKIRVHPKARNSEKLLVSN